MFVRELFRPLPDVTDEVHHPKRTGSFRMSADRIGTAHRAVLILLRNGGCVPLVAPRIEPAIGALRGVLPFPLVRQALPCPDGVGARILDGHPCNRSIFPA